MGRFKFSEVPDGDWVRYEDHVAELAQVKIARDKALDEAASAKEAAAQAQRQLVGERCDICGALEPLAPWQREVVEQRDELVGRLEKLEAYLKSDDFKHLNYRERNPLVSQRDAMRWYLSALEYRIDVFHVQKTAG